MTRLSFDHAANHVFLAARCIAPDIERSTSIGLERDGKLVAVAMYDQHNGPNVYVHVASDTKVPHRGFLYYCCAYPFIVLSAKRMTGTILHTNHKSLRLARHIGFEEEFVMKNGHLGGDLVYMVLWKERCRFLRPEFAKHFVSLEASV